MPGDERCTLVTAAALANLEQVRRFVERSAQKLGADGEFIPELVLAVDEAVTNIIVHGYRQALGPIEIELVAQGPSLLVRLRDEAPVFDPGTRSAAATDVSPLKSAPGGFGLHLIDNAMDAVSHRARAGGGNELTLVKHHVI